MMTMPQFDPTGIKKLAKELERLIQELKSQYADCKVNEYPGSVDHVDIAPDTLLEQNCRRVSWYLFNLSSNTIYIAFSNRVKSTRSIPLPSNKYIQFNSLEDPGVPQQEVFACASADASAIYLFEVVRDEIRLNAGSGCPTGCH